MTTKLKRGQYGYHFFPLKNRWKLHKSRVPIEGIIASDTHMKNHKILFVSPLRRRSRGLRAIANENIWIYNCSQ